VVRDSETVVDRFSVGCDYRKSVCLDVRVVAVLDSDSGLARDVQKAEVTAESVGVFIPVDDPFDYAPLDLIVSFDPTDVAVRFDRISHLEGVG